MKKIKKWLKKNKETIWLIYTILISVLFIWTLVYSIMISVIAEDLSNKVTILEDNIREVNTEIEYYGGIAEQLYFELEECRNER